MIDKKLVKRYDQNSLQVAMISGILSGVFSAIGGVGSGTNLIYNFIFGLAIGFLIPFAYIKAIYQILANKKIKALPYVLFIAINFFCLLLIALIVYFIAGVLFFKDYIFSNLPIALMITILLAFFFTVKSTFEQFIGKEVLKYILWGRYHNPKTEKKIVAFVDLAKSTDWAEKLSPDAFFKLINDFILIIEQCTELHDGQIYKYLGDGLIVVWPSDSKCYQQLSAFMCDLEDEIEIKQPYFEHTYGSQVQFSLGVNDGMLMVGELGFNRKELGYFGDTINVSSRLAGICGINNTSTILTTELYHSILQVEPKFSHYYMETKLGNVLLRGKKNEIDIIKLDKKQQ